VKRTLAVLVVLLAAPLAFAGAAPLNLLVTPRIAMAIVSKDDRKLDDLDKAYLDAFTILRDDNPCSRLYGGSAAIEALNELMRVVRPSYLEKHIAVRMSGETTMYRNAVTGFSFRMFEKAEINRAGSFYRGNGPTEPRVPLVADFQPNTRRTRVALLLHELGHLVRGADKKWVLSDDGYDLNLSAKNTEYVVQVCREEIESVTRMTVAQQLAEPLTTVAQLATLP
jgi:hypothetical protein